MVICSVRGTYNHVKKFELNYWVISRSEACCAIVFCHYFPQIVFLSSKLSDGYMSRQRDILRTHKISIELARSTILLSKQSVNLRLDGIGFKLGCLGRCATGVLWFTSRISNFNCLKKIDRWLYASHRAKGLEPNLKMHVAQARNNPGHVGF